MGAADTLALPVGDPDSDAVGVCEDDAVDDAVTHALAVALDDKLPVGVGVDDGDGTGSTLTVRADVAVGATVAVTELVRLTVGVPDALSAADAVAAKGLRVALPLVDVEPVADAAAEVLAVDCSDALETTVAVAADEVVILPDAVATVVAD